MFCLHVCVYYVHACLVPMKTRRQYWIPWNFSYGWLWTMWVLEVNLNPLREQQIQIYSKLPLPHPWYKLMLCSVSPSPRNRASDVNQGGLYYHPILPSTPYPCLSLTRIDISGEMPYFTCFWLPNITIHSYQSFLCYCDTSLGPVSLSPDCL